MLTFKNLIHHFVVPLSRLRARAPRGKTILNRFLTLSVSLRYPRGKVEGASLREGGAEQSEAEGARVSLFIYRWLFRTLNGTQAPSPTPWELPLGGSLPPHRYAASRRSTAGLYARTISHLTRLLSTSTIILDA